MTAPTRREQRGLHMRIPLGPTCRQCTADEASCARSGGCCRSCTHWLDLDVCGNDVKSVPSARRALPFHGHGTDNGYWIHRVRHEPPCGPCALAHLTYHQLEPQQTECLTAAAGRCGCCEAVS